MVNVNLRYKNSSAVFYFFKVTRDVQASRNDFFSDTMLGDTECMWQKKDTLNYDLHLSTHNIRCYCNSIMNKRKHRFNVNENAMLTWIRAPVSGNCYSSKDKLPITPWTN